LPYNSKREEWFTESESDKIAPVFTHSEQVASPEKSFQTLREYLSLFKSKKKSSTTPVAAQGVN